MPIFQYSCAHCNTVKDILCRHSASKVIKCPVCHEETMVRDAMQRPPVVQFVGYGWPGQEKKLADNRAKSGDITDESHAIKHNELKRRIYGDSVPDQNT